MTKFAKGAKVAFLSSWDNKGTITIRRATVHSCGKKVMRLQDEQAVMFGAAFQPEHNAMTAFNGIHVIADADDATLIAAALADGARVIELVTANANDRIARGDDFNIKIGNRYIAELHEPLVRWHGER